MKKTVIFDFDGVIHSYKSGWQGAGIAVDPPNEDVVAAIRMLRENEGYEVIVVSTRCASNEGMMAIQEYLAEHGIVVDGVMKEKPPALVTVDDRAICYKPGLPEELVSKVVYFSPWRAGDEEMRKCGKMKYRKKPVVIEAIQYDGLNIREIKSFVGDALHIEICDTAWQAGQGKPHTVLTIKTLEGDHLCSVGDYVIKGLRGEFYPCKPDIFKATYTAVEDDTPK